MPIKNYSAERDVQPWIAGALSDERWYEARTLSALGGQTSANTERTRSIKILLKQCDPDDTYIANRLQSCASGHRCLCGACHPCMRALQSWFAHEAKIIVDDLEDCVAISLVCEVTYPGLFPVHVTTSVANAFRNCGIRLALAGLDISFNEHRDGLFPVYAAYQIWAIVPARDRETWEPKLRAKYPPSPLVPRPVKILPFDKNPAGLAYAIKADFVRRVSYMQVREVDGNIRKFRNTSNQPLRIHEKLNLLRFLAAAGLAQRLLLIGARPTRTAEGWRLRRIVRPNE